MKKRLIASALLGALIADDVRPAKKTVVIHDTTPSTTERRVGTYTSSYGRNTRYGSHEVELIERPRYLVDIHNLDRFFLSIEMAIHTSKYDSNFKRRFGRELAYVILEGTSSGWKDSFIITYQTRMDLIKLVKAYGIAVSIHCSDHEYEELYYSIMSAYNDRRTNVL